VTASQQAIVALEIAAFHELKAQDALKAAKAAKHEALRALHLAGLPKCKVGEVARKDLAMHGFGPELLARLALSDASIRLVLDQK
jgi:hypothetical protein